LTISPELPTEEASMFRRPERHSASLLRNASDYACEPLESRLLLTGIWSSLNNPIPNSDGASLMLLLSDGTVMSKSGIVDGHLWYKLTPSNGSYTNGVWSQIDSINVGRLFFGSNVLPNGNVFVVGGEFGEDQSFSRSAEIYDTLNNSWSMVASFPQTQFGDDPTAMLPNGTVLAGYINGPQTYIYNPSTNVWTQTGTKLRGDRSDEETWMKLPDGSVLSYDIFSGISSGIGTAQRYVPATGQWVDAGTLPAVLSSSAVGAELGGALMLPDGRAMFFGATNGRTAYYSPSTNTWAAGPSIPGGFVAADAPCAMLPNGNVLMVVSPQGTVGTDGYNFPPPTKVYELNPTTNIYTDVTPSISGFDLLHNNGFITNLLVLPTGQVLLSNDSATVLIYTPDGAPQPAWKPNITGITSAGAGNFTLSGTQFNGISEGASYGDDNEMSENYPIVRIRNSALATSYGRTFNWSNTGVATGNTIVTTQMTASSFFGGRLMSVIASGIASPEVLDVEGTSGVDTIVVALNGSNIEVTVNGGGTQLFSTSLVTKVFINGLGGNDTILLDSIGPSVPVSIDAGSGDDLIALANASGNLDNIQSAVSIDGGAGSDEIQFSDNLATFSDTYTITNSTFSRDSFPGATYVNAELPDLFAESGNNTINVNSTANGTDWLINAGNGNDVLNWGAGNLDSMLGTASFDGQAGIDSVNVLDQGVNFSDDYTITSTTVARDFAATLTYLNAEGLTVACDTGNNTINVNSAGDPTSILANGGNDTLFIGAGNLGNLAALVTFNAGPGTDSATVDDSAASVATTYNITSGGVTATAGPFPGFNYSTLEFLSLNCGQANDTINVTSTATGTNTAVNGNGGSDFMSAGNGNLDFLAGHLTFNGGIGTDSVTISDASVNVGSGYVITASDITLTNPGAFAGFNYATLESVVLNTSSSDDGITINSTASGAPLTVNAGNGNDTLNFGNTTLANMAASVTFNGGVGTDTVNVNDQSDASGGTFAISTTAVSRSGVTGAVNFSATEALNVNGNGLGNTMNVNSAVAGIPLVVNSGNGNDVINVNAASAGSLVVVNAGDGNDILHVADPSDNLANVTGALTFNGQNGVNDQITLSDIAVSTAIAYTLGATTVARSGFGGLTYGTSELLTVSAGSGSDTFTVNAIGAPTVLNGNDGNDRLTVTAALASTLTFNGGTGATNTSDGITISPTVTAATGDYTPSSVTPGNGLLNINAHTINFTGLEGAFPSVSVSNVTTFTFFTPSSQDAVDVDTAGVTGGTANIISGTSNAVAMQRLLFDHVTNFILNTGLNDGVGGGNPDDIVNIHLNGLTATGLSTFRYIGGTSAANNDVINIDSGPLAFNTDAATDTANLTINASHSVAASPATVVTFNATQHLAGLNLSNDATASMPANGSHVLVTNALSATGTSKLDLFDNDLIVDYSAASPLAAIQSLINAARSGGTWLGNGLTSTTARTNSSHNTTLGAMEASDFKSIYGAAAPFDGQTIDTTAVLVKYTYYGDADFNGKVNFDDYVRTDSGFNNHRTGWTNGDFDGNGQVNFDDYVLIDLAFNTQSGTL
jgi:hypothetical protein